MEKIYNRRGSEDEGSVLEQFLIWCDTHRKIVGACAVGLVMVILLAFGTGESAAAARTEKEIRTLMQTYYSYRASGDTARLEEVAHPVSSMEKSYIQYISDSVDRFNDVTVLTAEGDTDGSWLVGAYSKVDFAGQRTSAPQLETYCVRRAEDGSLYIDNTYSSFNMANGEFPTDATVTSLLAAFRGSKEMTDLQAKVDAELAKAYENDSLLQEYVTVTLQDTINSWVNVYQEQQRAAEEAAAVTLYLQETVSVRESAAEDAPEIGTLAKGTAVKQYSSANGWSQIAYGEGRGFVLSEKLGDTAPEGSVINIGDVIRLKDALNIRSGRGTDTEKIATAYAGEELTVLEDSIDGWTKVSYKNIYQGYVKSEFLLD